MDALCSCLGLLHELCREEAGARQLTALLDRFLKTNTIAKRMMGSFFRVLATLAGFDFGLPALVHAGVLEMFKAPVPGQAAWLFRQLAHDPRVAAKLVRTRRPLGFELV
jgi:hypothetical protein